MTVIDASVAVKLVVAETDSANAERWYLEAEGDIIAPDFIVVEVAQAIVRRVNMREVTRQFGDAALKAWGDILDGSGIILVRSSTSMVRTATVLAMDLGHPLKDCLYLSHAIDAGCQLVTSDARFKAKAGTHQARIVLLTDTA